jgi:hypothetical protein
MTINIIAMNNTNETQECCPVFDPEPWHEKIQEVIFMKLYLRLALI